MSWQNCRTPRNDGKNNNKMECKINIPSSLLSFLYRASQYLLEDKGITKLKEKKKNYTRKQEKMQPTYVLMMVIDHINFIQLKLWSGLVYLLKPPH